MICQECKERPATFHFTKVVNGEKQETHMCEYCAKETGSSSIANAQAGFSINSLLAGLLNMETAFGNKPQKDLFKKEDVLKCSRCGFTFNQFAKAGRFGCAECYKTFSSHVTPVLRRVHSGNTTHGGKIPQRIGGTIQFKKRIEELKTNLTELIAQEEFEKAAEVRDEIRKLNQQLNEKKEEGQ
ncbi:hypothetical protein GJU40_10500 [Bacillus lacus]|uniref:UVR domain-containing protein n=1 Tax=Metabacillus lacus TaxID=1983721 RepID=A0A7X2LYP6_9BACI|nr:hypothetical protein [Metabacillus lacus]